MWLSLIGFNACGKTTLSRELGRLAGRPVVDLDHAVADLAGRPVPEIFAAGGTAAFRDLERRALLGLPVGEPLVLATGSGTLEEPEATGWLQARGLVVWLDAAWPHLRRRLVPAPGAAPPPVWQHLGQDILQKLYARRRPLYAAAARLRLDAAEDPIRLARRLLGRCRQLEAMTRADGA
jgi:shikimate kinase